MTAEASTLPNHIAIIPDGNRRWAKEHGLAPWAGHAAGAKMIEVIVEAARERGIRELSFWGSSLENLVKRPMEEKRELLRIYTENFTRLLESPEIHKHEVRIRCIGHWEEQFPESLKQLLRRGMEATSHYSRHFLNFFLAYNGDDDMLQAIQHIAGEEFAPGMITGDVLKKHLMTAEVAPVDLLIRTGGDPHLSTGFMMWETKDAALAFPEVFFPDFDAAAFNAVVDAYVSGERRFGK